MYPLCLLPRIFVPECYLFVTNLEIIGDLRRARFLLLLLLLLLRTHARTLARYDAIEEQHTETLKMLVSLLEIGFGREQRVYDSP